MFQTSMFEQGAMPTLLRATAFAEQRQRVIANNIANAETPHFQAMDLPQEAFRERLKEAIMERRSGNPRHYNFRDDAAMHDSSGNLKVAPRGTLGGILRHSRNNVDIDKESAKMASNAMYHSIMTQLLQGQFNKLSMAIRGQP